MGNRLQALRPDDLRILSRTHLAWLNGDLRPPAYPAGAKSSRKAATAILATWAKRHQHAIAVSRRNTTIGSATIRQIKFFSYRTDSGAPF